MPHILTGYFMSMSSKNGARSVRALAFVAVTLGVVVVADADGTTAPCNILGAAGNPCVAEQSA